MNYSIKTEISNNPNIKTNTILPSDTREEAKKKNKKQFITTKECVLTVIIGYSYLLKIYAQKGYEFDGATIPFNIGKGNMKLLIPALFHDIMCGSKILGRELSTKIFKSLLLDCKVNSFVAEVMAIAVDLWQKFVGRWK